MSCFRDNRLHSTRTVLFSLLGTLSMYNHLKGEILADFICVFGVIQLTRIVCIL